MRERYYPCNVCDKAFKSLQMPNQHKICKGCGKKFKTQNSINRHKMLFGFPPHHRKSFCNFFMRGKGGGGDPDGSIQLQKEGKHSLPSQLKIYYLFLIKKIMCILKVFSLYICRLDISFVKSNLSWMLLQTTTFIFFMKNIFIFEMAVKMKMLSVSPANNILILHPRGKIYKSHKPSVFSFSLQSCLPFFFVSCWRKRSSAL